MISRFGASILTVMFLAFATAPVAAQGWNFDVGVNGGGSFYTNSLDDDDLPFGGSGEFESGWLVGAQATGWLTDIFGVRANGTYTERPFELEFGTFGDGAFIGEIDDINLWGGTGDLLIRFLGTDQRGFLGVDFLPFLALGAGAKWIDPAGGLDIDIDGFDLDGVPFLATDDGLWVLNDETKFMGLVGLGSDIRIAPNFGLRLDIGDRIWDSPISRFTLDDDGDIIAEDDDVGDVIHELYGQLGLHLLLGVEEPEPVVAAAPAPPAPPAPEPEPEEEAVTVCVVDPSLPGGVADIQGVFRPATGDTLITIDGQQLTVAEARRRGMVARDAQWFVAGEPLMVQVDGETTEYVTFGSARIVEPEDLALLGTLNGVPVYADADEVQDIAEELEERREAEMEDDIEELLEEDEDLREDFEDIEVLYVPLEVTDCVFQPLERVEEVRKIRG